MSRGGGPKQQWGTENWANNAWCSTPTKVDSERIVLELQHPEPAGTPGFLELQCPEQAGTQAVQGLQHLLCTTQSRGNSSDVRLDILATGTSIIPANPHHPIQPH